DVPDAVERVAASGKPDDQIRARDRFEGVARGDPERGGHGTGRGDVDEEGPEKDSRPPPGAQKDESRQRDTRGSPDGRGARVDEGDLQPQLARSKVDGCQQRDTRRRRERAGLLRGVPPVLFQLTPGFFHIPCRNPARAGGARNGPKVWKSRGGARGTPGRRG